MRYKLYKIYIITKKIVIVGLFTLFMAVVLFLGNGLFEKGAVNRTTIRFKDRGVFEKTIEIQGQEVSIYKIKPKYEYEKKDNRKVFDINSESKYYIGSDTDIILTTRNPLRNNPNNLIRDICGFLAANFYIGHATMNINESGSKYIESVGNNYEDDGVAIRENSWIETEVRYGNDAQMIVGLRVKDLTEEERLNILNEAKKLEGKKYNYTIILPSRNRYYCTDLITYCFKKAKINLNYDRLYTTGNDLIVSEQTYMIFLCERIQEGKFEIYYMSEE